MYKIRIEGYEVECESPEDVRALVGRPASRDLTQGRSLTKKRSRKKKRTAPDGRATGIQRSWEEARKEAKKQGREDVAAVRSELSKARKKK